MRADYRWEQAGEVPHMGELPPSCSTPQGPDVPRASRPGFLRVDSSGTSSAPLSRSASFPFLASSSLHFTHLLSLGAFPPPSRSPFPSPSFPFLASSSLQFSPRSDTASSTELSALVHSCFPPLSSRSFPFLASGSRVLPPLSRGSVSVARGSRRSAPTPLQRSGKVSRERWNT